MLTIMMANVTAKRIGMVTANTSAHLTLIVKAMIIAPNTMNGLRSSRRRPMFRPVCTWFTSSEMRVISVSPPRLSSWENENDWM